MKKMLMGMILLVLAVCSLGAREMIGSLGNSRDWDEKGLLNMGEVYVRSIDDRSGSDQLRLSFGTPLQPLPGAPEGWDKMLPEKTIILPHSKAVAFTVVLEADLRWLRLDPLTYRVGESRIDLLSTQYWYNKPHIKNYMPSYWIESVFVEGLLPGEYAVYLGESRMVGVVLVE